MKCPKCHTKLGGEKYPEVQETDGYMKDNHYYASAIHRTSGIFYCNNCDTEFNFLNRKLIEIDSPSFKGHK